MLYVQTPYYLMLYTSMQTPGGERRAREAPGAGTCSNPHRSPPGGTACESLRELRPRGRFIPPDPAGLFSEGAGEHSSI